MSEINLYQIDDVITKAMGPLLLKVLDEKKKALIFCSNKTKLKEIDDSLWSYGKNKFIPHLTKLDQDIAKEFTWQRQPIVISEEEENLNHADYLVLVNNPSADFAKKFSRVFYFFDPENLSEVKKFSKNFQRINFYKKQDAKWVKEQLS